MQTMLTQRQSDTKGSVKTVKPFRLQPRVIYLKNKRDKVLLMTDKRATADVPECEHGYWGGFSPKRQGKYEDKDLSKKYDNGRARLYPTKKIPGSLKKTSTPKRYEMKIESVDGISQSPVAGFKIHTSNDKANFEL